MSALDALRTSAYRAQVAEARARRAAARLARIVVSKDDAIPPHPEQAGSANGADCSEHGDSDPFNLDRRDANGSESGKAPLAIVLDDDTGRQAAINSAGSDSPFELGERRTVDISDHGEPSGADYGDVFSDDGYRNDGFGNNGYQEDAFSDHGSVGHNDTPNHHDAHNNASKGKRAEPTHWNALESNYLDFDFDFDFDDAFAAGGGTSRPATPAGCGGDDDDGWASDDEDDEDEGRREFDRITIATTDKYVRTVLPPLDDDDRAECQYLLKKVCHICDSLSVLTLTCPP